MNPTQIPSGTPCRTIDVNGADVGNCLFMSLEILDNRWHYIALKDEKMQELSTLKFTLIPLDLE